MRKIGKILSTSCGIFNSVLKFLVLISVLTHSVAMSQEIEFTSGDKLTIPSFKSMLPTLGTLDTRVWVVGKFEEGYYLMRKFQGVAESSEAKVKFLLLLEHFDSELNLVRSKEIPVEYQGNWGNFYSTFQWKEQLYFISKSYSKETREAVLIAQTLDLKTMELGPSKVIGSMPLSHGSPQNWPFFTMNTSPDDSHLLVSAHSKTGALDINYRVFTEGFVEIRRSKEEFPNPREDVSNIQMMISDFGNVYALVLSKISKKSEYKGIVLQELSLVTCQRDQVQKKIQVDVPLSIGSYSYMIEEGDKIVVAGFFTEKPEVLVKQAKKERPKGVRGVFYYKYDLTSEKVLVNRVNYFEDSFLRKNATWRGLSDADISKKDARQLTYGIEGMYVRSLSDRGEGNLALIAERSIDDDNNYIMVVPLDGGGHVGKITTISKYQGSVCVGQFGSLYQQSMQVCANRFGSFGFIRTDEYLTFYFNSGITAREHTPKVVRLDKENNLYSFDIPSLWMSRSYVMPRKSREVAEDEILIYRSNVFSTASQLSLVKLHHD